MADKTDTYRAAHLLIKGYGRDAVTFAAERADSSLRRGNYRGVATWHAVMKAIEELQDPSPPPDGTATH